VVPTLTVKVPGVKVKLTMLTVLLELVVLAVEAAVFDVEQPVNPNNSAPARIKVIINAIFFFIFAS